MLNRQNALKLLYNCIDIPIAEESAYIGADIDYTVSDTTLIQKYLDITKVSGRVTRTPLASITGSRCSNGHIAVLV